jgi:hypothetical protein
VGVTTTVPTRKGGATGDSDEEADVKETLKKRRVMIIPIRLMI